MFNVGKFNVLTIFVREPESEMLCILLDSARGNFQALLRGSGATVRFRSRGDSVGRCALGQTTYAQVKARSIVPVDSISLVWDQVHRGPREKVGGYPDAVLF